METPRYFDSYIVNLVSADLIPLVTAPESLSESIGAQYNEQDILARSAPIITYTGTGARQVSYSIRVHEDILPDKYRTIDEYVNALKALVYPEYSNGVVSPPSVKLILGTSLNIIGVPQSVDVTWGTDVYRDNRIIMANISISIKETRASCPGATTIRNGG